MIIHNLRQQLSKLKKKKETKEQVVVVDPKQTEELVEARATLSMLMSRNDELVHKVRNLENTVALNESRTQATVAEAKLQVMSQMMSARFSTGTPDHSETIRSGSQMNLGPQS